MLHKGRGDLCTVTAAHTVAAHPTLRADGPALNAAARGCDAVLRLFDSEEANAGAYNLLCRYLGILDGSESLTGDGSADGAAGLATALAYRLKLALAAGFSPELASCARCGGERRAVRVLGLGRRRRLRRMRGGAGSRSRQRRTSSWSRRWASRWRRRRRRARAPCARPERAVTETLEHHAHVHLRAAA